MGFRERKQEDGTVKNIHRTRYTDTTPRRVKDTAVVCVRRATGAGDRASVLRGPRLRLSSVAEEGPSVRQRGKAHTSGRGGHAEDPQFGKVHGQDAVVVAYLTSGEYIRVREHQGQRVAPEIAERRRITSEGGPGRKKTHQAQTRVRKIRKNERGTSYNVRSVQ